MHSMYRSMNSMKLAAAMFIGVAALAALAAPGAHAQSAGATSVSACATKGCGAPAVQPIACESLYKRGARIPAAVLDNALTFPTSIGGWDQLMNPNVPESPSNTRKRSLQLADTAKAYHPLYNGLGYYAGCR
ncbi:MAG: hypothetical protein DYG90_02595 [Chloroflexi bacterium CFX6]|nr:hypothetical protein [Chloroflexi bacterium CFX6]